MLIFCCCSHYCRSTNCTRNLTGWLSMKGFDHLFISFFDLFPLKVEFNVAFPNEYRLFFYTSFSLLEARSTKEEPHDVGISGLVFFYYYYFNLLLLYWIYYQLLTSYYRIKYLKTESSLNIYKYIIARSIPCITSMCLELWVYLYFSIQISTHPL